MTNDERKKRVRPTTVEGIFKALKAPYKPNKVKSKLVKPNQPESQNNPRLFYIDARDVQNRLDEVLGLENWKTDFVLMNKSDEKNDVRILCYLSIKLPSGEWLTKVDGAGESQFEGEKGALSDAFKRAAVMFGIGRYLYTGIHPAKYYEAWMKANPEGEKEDA